MCGSEGVTQDLQMCGSEGVTRGLQMCGSEGVTRDLQMCGSEEVTLDLQMCALQVFTVLGGPPHYGPIYVHETIRDGPIEVCGVVMARRVKDINKKQNRNHQLKEGDLSGGFPEASATPLEHNCDTIVQPENVLSQQYENRIRPCIDLIDSLRALGVEKDLALPAIAVIGDQSSGKSSVLEALSGVCLPRGSGIVTRCPLELKLKKSASGLEWSGKISYETIVIDLKSPAAVEDEVRKAQNFIAGEGNSISDKLITLEVVSPDVPDLTLIDLPGITRVALPNQPPDIGRQIKLMIKKYISRQETINLVVVPSNVDIATTEALEMAKKVDPDGERTLGILSKPDLVDKGAEADIVDVVKNLSYPLKKGYMIVKCRGQSEIQSKLSLKNAIDNEKAFFENHEHFRVLLREGNATIPTLAERLTVELVEHIERTLPTLEEQILVKLREAEDNLHMIGRGVPDTETEKLALLVEKIRQFSEGIGQATEGEEELTNGHMKLFTDIRRHFNSWEQILKKSVDKFPREIRNDVHVYETKHRGRELTGFISFRTFEHIAKKQIQTFEHPAILQLNEVTELVRSSFNNVASRNFLQHQNLYRSAKGKLEHICSVQQKKAEEAIKTQFQMEKIIYCQDALYGKSLKETRDEAEEEEKEKNKRVGFKQEASQLQLSVEEMSCHIQAYFTAATARLANQIPLIIQHYILYEIAHQLQAQMMQLIQDRENLDLLLQEKQGLGRERKNIKDRIQRLHAAQLELSRFPN
ncbi:PREDICTED: interferon-induced GTP-binding protein Mx-like [Nanorana parkeri]|uniref:interferon-induced GTP-binding protein Mx-like n=1 Tax=Nanorana parkeri TaxID=125878 RepID=UPI0008547394|nr:PREDICTED: interferon-induced GTP-binding protein Mx-like [Nanorana parkeri]